jgi:preprotein translocase subunit YajC
MSHLSIWAVGSVFAMGAAPDGGSPWVQFVPFAIVLAIFYFIILLPMKRKQQKVTQFLESLKVNDRIVTTGGIYGQITRLGEQTVQVQIADKVRIEVAKAAIGGYQGQDPVQEAVGERASQ